MNEIRSSIYKLYHKISNKGYLISLFIFFLANSCTPKSSFYQGQIEQAQLLVQEFPDSTLFLMDSLLNTTELSDKEFYKCNLLRIKAKDKLFQDISQDTIIYHITSFFERSSDVSELANAYYYSGRVSHEKGIYSKAINYYLLANKYATDYDLKAVISANIGYLLYHQFEFREALDKFFEAKEYLSHGDNSNNHIYILLDIGNCYAMMAQKDSADIYYTNSIELAESIGQKDIRIKAVMNLGASFLEQKNYDDALLMYRDALSLTDNDTSVLLSIYLCLAEIHSKKNNVDSTFYYLEQGVSIEQEVQDLYLQSQLYDGITDFYKTTGNFEKAFENLLKYNSIAYNIYIENEKKEILNIEKKYQFKEIQNQKNELYIKYQKSSLIALSIILLLIIFLFMLFYWNQKKKALLDEAEEKILNLNSLALSYDKKQKNFRNTLLHHFDILKKSATLQFYLKENETKQEKRLLSLFNDIIYKQQELDWNMLYNAMNDLHDNFLDRLRYNVPELDENEFKICCLIFSEFSNQEIALILKLSSSTISHKRSAIRQKMGLEDYGNISEYLKKMSSNIE